MADSKPIAGRVHPDVHKAIKEEANNRGTTLGSLVEEILRGWYTGQLEEKPIDDEGLSTDEPVNDAAMPVASIEQETDWQSGDEVLKVEAGTRARANAIRDEFGELIHQADDKRMTTVTLEPAAEGYVRESEQMRA